MKSTSYFAGYKDGPKAPIRYFGPFVSTSVADFFLAALPKPRKGGWKAVRHLQPYSVQEGHTVAEMIKRERDAQQPVGRRVSSRQ